MESLTWQQLRLLHLLILAACWSVLLISLLARVMLDRSKELSTSHELGDGSGPDWSRRASIIGFFIAILIFVVAYGWLSVTRHNRFNSTGYDLSISEQVVWNSLNGRFFATSLEVDNSFADHFRPFFLAVVPVYAISQTPETLLILQTIVLASAAIPLYLLAYARLEDRRVALAVVLAYLLYPSLGFIARFDFHIEVFAIPAFIAAFYAMDKDRWGWATLWLVIPLLCKETMGLTVAMYGLYALVIRRRFSWGFMWIAGGLFTFWFTSFVLIPGIRGEPLDALTRYSWLGDTPGQMLAAFFSDPGRIFRHLTTPDRLLYLLQISLPVGFLNLLGLPEFLLSLPGITTNVLASHFCQPTIYCHYTVPVVPFVFIATVFGLCRLKAWLPGSQAWRLAGYLIVLLSLGSFLVDNPFRDHPLLPSYSAEISNADVVRSALSVVSDSLSVVTTNDYAPHLARRSDLYILGFPSQREAPIDPDIVFLNLYDQQYVVCDEFREYLRLLDTDVYGVTFRTGGLIVIQRNVGSNEQFRDFINNWNNCAG